MLKIYQSIRAFKLVTEIAVDGELMTIEFAGGIKQPRRTNGHFSTNSKKIQKAIENRPGFGKSYKLARTIEDNLSKKEDVQEPAKPKAKVEVIDDEHPEGEDLPGDYTNIEKAQDARDILFDIDKELTYNDVKSKVQIHEQAKRLNISFPNLPKQ